MSIAQYTKQIKADIAHHTNRIADIQNGLLDHFPPSYRKQLLDQSIRGVRHHSTVYNSVVIQD